MVFGGVQVARFMQPAPKPAPRGPCGFGRKWMIRFHNDEKPTTGTRLLELAITSEINRICNPLFHIRANSCEWTSAQNLIVFFTSDSTDAQITKASKTLLGIVAKGCSKTVIVPCVKWSRVVIHDFPTKTWVRDDSPDSNMTGGIPGFFAPVTNEVMVQAVRDSHPLLTDAVFTEGPSWTSLDALSRDRANVSFTIPDADDSRVKALTKRPLYFLNTACRLSQWTERSTPCCAHVAGSTGKRFTRTALSDAVCVVAPMQRVHTTLNVRLASSQT